MVQHNSIDHSGLLSVSYASNSTNVSTTSAAGASSLVSRADHVHKRIGEELDYVQFTSTVSITATTEATANTIVTASAIAFDGATTIIIEFFTPGMNLQATAGVSLILYLYDGANSVGPIAQTTNPASAAFRHPATVRVRLTPGNTTKTYSIRGTTGSGTSSIFAGTGGSAGAYWPGYIRITRA